MVPAPTSAGSFGQPVGDKALGCVDGRAIDEHTFANAPDGTQDPLGKPHLLVSGTTA